MRKVENRIHVAKPPNAVLAAFTDPVHLKGWWNVERCLVDLKPGGVYTLAWEVTEAGFGFVSSGIIRHYRPGRELELENMVYLKPDRPILGPMQLLIVVDERPGGTELFAGQYGYREGPDWDWYYEAVQKAWPGTLQTIKTYLEGID